MTKRAYYSNAEWPTAAKCHVTGITPQQFSDDCHNNFDNAQENYDAAAVVCERLKENGYGGQGRIFPLRTWVSLEPGGEPVKRPLTQEEYETYHMIKSYYYDTPIRWDESDGGGWNRNARKKKSPACKKKIKSRRKMAKASKKKNR